MDLLSFTSLKVGNSKWLAEQINEAPSFVSQMARGSRPIPPAVAVKIEVATGRQVTRQEMFANWREIWPELEELPASAIAQAPAAAQAALL